MARSTPDRAMTANPVILRGVPKIYMMASFYQKTWRERGDSQLQGQPQNNRRSTAVHLPINCAYCSCATKVNIRIVPHVVSSQPVPDQPSLLGQIHDFKWEEYRTGAVPNARMISPWLMRTRWPEHFEQYRPYTADLRNLVAMPTETALGRLHHIAKSYFHRATGLLDSTDELVLQKLNSHDPDKDGINNTPLHAHHQPGTLDGYVVPVTHFVAGLLRTSEHYSFPTSRRLTAALSAFQEAEYSINTLHFVLMALWKAERSKTRDCKMPDPTMCFLMLQSVDTHGSFADPKQTTGLIARLCRCIQLAMVTEIHRLVEKGRRPSQIQAFEDISSFVIEKEMTTFSSLMSLQHYASALVFQSMSLPNIWWMDRENWEVLLYKGRRITLTQLGEIFDKLEAEIIDLWENKVLMGLKLHAKYKDLADNLTHAEPGSSFLDDPSNPFHALRTGLADAIFNDPELVQKFQTIDADGNEHVNIIFCRQWMMSLAELEGLVMLAIDMISGAPPRGTELVSMLARNSLTRLRNLRALGKFIAIIRQYDKTTNNTQADHLIPHAVSAVNADVLIQLHTFARPLAQETKLKEIEQFLSSIVFPLDKELVTSYAEMLFMDYGKVFTSDKLTLLMSKWSGPILGWEMKMSHWRQINIAWRRKLCGRAAEDIEADTAGTVNALQSGHSWRTENQMYGRSPEAQLGVAEDLLHLFLLASTDWQKANKVVPGGLCLPYQDSTRAHYTSLVLDGTIKLKNAPSTVNTVVVANPIANSALSQMFVEFERSSTRASKTIVAKQDESMQVLTALLAEVTLLRREVAAQRPLLLPTTPKTFSPLPDSHLTPNHPATPSTCLTPRSWQLNPPPSRPVGPRPSPPWTPSRRSKKPSSPIADLEYFAGLDQPLRSAPDPMPNAPGSKPDLLHSLRKLYGPTADWRDPKQYKAVRELLALENDVIVALKTGGGKTPVAILPSMVENGYTVIILPLVLLMADWERRLVKLRLPHNLILVSSDVAKHGRWTQAIMQLHSGKKPVLWYVMDEVAYYFSDYDFRTSLVDPFALRVFPFQMVLMSATIPPGAELFLQKQFMLVNPTRLSTLSERAELRVIIEKPCSDFAQQITVAKQRISDITQRSGWAPRHRFLVFVTRTEDGQHAAKALGLPFYHAGIKEEEREKMYSNWVAGLTPGIVATTALGAGTDYPNVLFTIHLGLPFDLVTFEQQRGRAARGPGTRGRNFLIPVRTSKFYGKVDETWGDIRGAEAMFDLVFKRPAKPYPQACLVYATTQFIDGRGNPEPGQLISPRKLLPEAPLAWTPPHGIKRKLHNAFGSVVEESRKRVGATIEVRHGKLQVFFDLFDLAGDSCGYCFARGRPNAESRHKYWTCPCIDKEGRQKSLSAFRRVVKYEGSNRPCYTCHIFSFGQNALHPDYLAGSERFCPQDNLAVGVALAVFFDSDLHKRALGYFQPEKTKKSWATIEEYADWFSQRHEEYMWNSMALLKWAKDHLYQ
ncbi:hypothetical protein B0H10DRAFT_2201885 [Mycena sp. CBHHK59/15]|nr:hypothetical protein B0H10DRAFT_2201885 [Mycena sp. CBHHK59/15]